MQSDLPNLPPITPPPKQLHDLEATLTPQQRVRLGKWGQKRRGALLRAWAGTCSPRAAIKLQCLDCCGEDGLEVANCECRCCPLWRFRPFQHLYKKKGQT